MTQAQATRYQQLQDRVIHPSGKTKNGKWYPSVEEYASCCKHVREPSRAYPYSLMRHCRTKKHIITRDTERTI